MRKISKYFMVLITILISACASQYVSPTKGSQAKLRLIVSGDNYFAFMHTYERQESCQGPIFMSMLGGEKLVNANSVNNSLLNMIGSQQKIDSHISEKVIPAGKPFTVRYGQIGPHDLKNKLAKTCEFSVTFIPNDGSQYELKYSFNEKSCFVVDSKVSLSVNGDITHEPIAGLIKKDTKCLATQF